MRGGSVRSGDDEVGLERLGRDGERRRGGRRGERERVVGVQDRERDQMDEEISTIFVVGFPEDMTVSLSLTLGKSDRSDRVLTGPVSGS